MLSTEERKAAVKAYKEREVRRGIYAVRSKSTGRRWVDSALNLDTTKNGLWHTLDSGRHLNRSLQAEWTRLGADEFEYEILEVLKDDVPQVAVKDLLKEKKRLWQEQVDA